MNPLVNRWIKSMEWLTMKGGTSTLSEEPPNEMEQCIRLMAIPLVHWVVWALREMEACMTEERWWCVCETMLMGSASQSCDISACQDNISELIALSSSPSGSMLNPYKYMLTYLYSYRSHPIASCNFLWHHAETFCKTSDIWPQWWVWRVV